MRHPLIEGCVDSYASAAAACKGGADRLELCANLTIGGTTPSAALFQQVRRDFDVPVNVLIRPRFGDFLYSPEELEEILEEIRHFRGLGADGVVIGALTPEGRLDEAQIARMVEAAGPLTVTLHRAFDMTRDPLEALETAAALGCTTVLTSGQAQSAAAGWEVLRDLVRRAGDRIDVMAGSGVNPGNIRDLHARTGVWCFHTSGRAGALDSGMVYRKASVSMGLPSLSEYEIWRTDEAVFRSCAELVHGLTG